MPEIFRYLCIPGAINRTECTEYATCLGHQTNSLTTYLSAVTCGPGDAIHSEKSRCTWQLNRGVSDGNKAIAMELAYTYSKLQQLIEGSW